MKRVILLLALAGCSFSQKHPGVTVGLVAGSIGFGACGLAVEKLGTCSLIGASAGLVLGGITGLVTLFADTSAHQLPPDDEEVEPYKRVQSTTPPPPGLPPGDAGVPTMPEEPPVEPPASAAPGNTAPLTPKPIM